MSLDTRAFSSCGLAVGAGAGSRVQAWTLGCASSFGRGVKSGALGQGSLAAWVLPGPGCRGEWQGLVRPGPLGSFTSSGRRAGFSGL